MSVSADRINGHLQTTSSPTKAKKPSTIRLRHHNNFGPCPNRSCKHPPADHRPIANSKEHFCYHKHCMNECQPGVRKV